MEVVATTANNLYTDTVGPLMEAGTKNYHQKELCCHLEQCSCSPGDSMLNQTVAHLHNLLAFCWSHKVSKDLFDNVFAFGGL